MKRWERKRKEGRAGFPLVALAALIAALPALAGAQGLQRGSAAPLQAGINRDRADSFGGNRNWYFYGGPGPVTVRLRYRADTVLGVPMRTALTFTLSDRAQTWHSTTRLASVAGNGAGAYTFQGNVSKKTEIIVTVSPATDGFVREGGTYDIAVSGAVAYGRASAADPIVGTYGQTAYVGANIGVTAFRRDGSIVSATGATGRWTLDRASHGYAVTIGDQKFSLLLRRGTGLVDRSNPEAVLFTSMQ